MAGTREVDLCVIGAGSGGLSVAAGASQMGASTVLIEKGKMGGDCLNYGCVPSKALLAAGHAAEGIRRSARFGVSAGAPAVDFARAHDHVQQVIAAIAPNDSEERFRGLGVEVIRAPARFTGPRTVVAGDREVRARRFVVATGSSPLVPPIPGLESVPFFTNETVFDNREPIEHLIVVGGGPIGIEMAQAHRQLGARVTVIEMFTILPKDDPELIDVVRRRIVEEGVEVRERVKVTRIEGAGQGVRAVLEGERGEEAVAGSHLLVATGRRANVAGLGLEAAGVEFTPRGIRVDRRLRTSNRRIYAIGDVVGGYQFTHMAAYHAGIVIRNALFRIPARVDDRAVPWVTYTAPELAQVGLTEARARERAGGVRVLRWPYHENDRAQAERATEGLIKVVTTTAGHVLGAGIVGRAAGEIISLWGLAIVAKVKIGTIAGLIMPYPTLAEVGKRAAGSFYTPRLFGDSTRRLVRFLAHFG
ncbi:MAG: FAD-dependent oxidoreductase [Proteobacteria bacterium]|nr:FAD-dependent oxidoreductase [Pseudomonadota bacterium]